MIKFPALTEEQEVLYPQETSTRCLSNDDRLVTEEVLEEQQLLLVRVHPGLRRTDSTDLEVRDLA